jgi:hypothetical protein
MLLGSAGGARAADDLAAGFKTPPYAAGPHTWWHWVSGNVSKDGITKDLEAMKRIGVAGAQMFSVDQVPNPKDRGTVYYMTPEWRDAMKHAISEADRLGITLSIVDCEGWSESGGPWITPAESMQKIVWTEQRVTGPAKFDEPLPQPEKVRDYYEDIAVYAFPTLPGEMTPLAKLNPRITTSDGGSGEIDSAKMFDGDVKTKVEVKPVADKKEAFVTLELPEPQRISSFTLAPIAPQSKVEVQLSDDGKSFRKVGEYTTNRKARERQSFVFPETHAKFVRVFTAKTPTSRPLTIAEIEMGSARVPDFRAKTGIENRVVPDAPAPVNVSADTIIKPDTLIELTKQIDAGGKLTWDVPAGEWTIVRIGHTSTGKENHPTMQESRGLECDKMSAEAVRKVWDNAVGKVVAENKDLAGKSLKLVLMDSWEAGCENWTPKFREEFKKRRGYDIDNWLPAMTGRYVESPEKTERFLWDVRRTIADLIAENHYGQFQKLCHENNMLLTAEAPGIGMPTIADAFQCKNRTDVPMGEFWVNRYDDNADTRETASAAHTWGTRIAAAESFTATPENAGWRNDPYSLKIQGDEQYTCGINRFVFHRYAHQADERKPGMTMGPWGINFERTNTWWEPGRAWISYLTRCQYMLQRGLFVGDLLYYYGEGTPRSLRPGQLTPPPPAGYGYDGCGAELLLTRLSVKDGRLVLPDGMSYKVLVLPDTTAMTPQVLAKVRELVEAGATVYGPKPKISPSLRDYPKADEAVAKAADEVWGDADGKTVTEHAFGRGRIVWGKPLTEVIGEPRDFESKTADGKDANFRYIHRRDGDADFYFVSNPADEFAGVECAFRVTGKAPELWNAQTGEMQPALAYRVENGRTIVPIRFEPAGSVFVVFRKPAGEGADAITSIKSGDRELLTEAVANPAPKPTLEIRRATYGVLEDPKQQMDVTEKLRSAIKGSTLLASATNDMAGRDPAINVPKKLRLDYSLGGEDHTLTVNENQPIRLPTGMVLNGHPAVELKASEDGQPALEAWNKGEYTVATAGGKSTKVSVADVPAESEITGQWLLTFPPKSGAPDSITLDKLIAWDQHDQEGVKHFSGTATYAKQINIDEKLLGDGKSIYLDLGEVKNLAEVTLNGQDVGILWKPPFRVNVTKFAKPGSNELRVKVTNLWPNRLIGDAGLPPEQRTTWAAY